MNFKITNFKIILILIIFILSGCSRNTVKQNECKYIGSQSTKEPDWYNNNKPPADDKFIYKIATVSAKDIYYKGNAKKEVNIALLEYLYGANIALKGKNNIHSANTLTKSSDNIKNTQKVNQTTEGEYYYEREGYLQGVNYDESYFNKEKCTYSLLAAIDKEFVNKINTENEKANDIYENYEDNILPKLDNILENKKGYVGLKKKYKKLKEQIRDALRELGSVGGNVAKGYTDKINKKKSMVKNHIEKVKIIDKLNALFEKYKTEVSPKLINNPKSATPQELDKWINKFKKIDESGKIKKLKNDYIKKIEGDFFTALGVKFTDEFNTLFQKYKTEVFPTLINNPKSATLQELDKWINKFKKIDELGKIKKIKKIKNDYIKKIEESFFTAFLDTAENVFKSDRKRGFFTAFLDTDENVFKLEKDEYAMKLAKIKDEGKIYSIQEELNNTIKIKLKEKGIDVGKEQVIRVNFHSSFVYTSSDFNFDIGDYSADTNATMYRQENITYISFKDYLFCVNNTSNYECSHTRTAINLEHFNADGKNSVIVARENNRSSLVKIFYIKKDCYKAGSGLSCTITMQYKKG